MNERWRWPLPGCGISGINQTPRAPVEQRAELAARADRTLAMIRATGEAPRVMRSIAATQFLDLGRQEGLDLQVPGEEE